MSEYFLELCNEQKKIREAHIRTQNMLKNRNKTKLKTGDLVKIITGKHRGMVDYISHLDPKEQVVYLKKISRKKYDKSTPDSKKKSELKEIMVPIHISNVAFWMEKKKTITKIGFQEVNEKKVRKSRKYNITVN